MTDRRLTPATPRVAHVSLEGVLPAPRYVAGQPASVTAPLADLCATPDGARDRQLLLGAAVRVIDAEGAHAFVRAEADGYCGWVAQAALGPEAAATDRVAAPASHLYPEPNLKSREICALSHGSRLQIVARHGAFAETASGAFVPAMHLRPAGSAEADPVAVAGLFLGTPYLWGGNSIWGIDCSGLVQAALQACGIACPGDSDLQFAALGHPVDLHDLARGDLLFWKDHVAIATGPDEVIHANAHHMAVTTEDLVAALARIAEAPGGELLGVRRL